MPTPDLDRLEQLARDASPPPWQADRDGRADLRNVRHMVHSGETLVAYGQLTAADAAFIAAAREAVPALVAEVRRLRESIRWRCRECGCAFPDHPTLKLPPDLRAAHQAEASRCTRCVEVELLGAEVRRLRAELARRSPPG